MGYILYYLYSYQVFISRDIIFYESVFHFRPSSKVQDLHIVKLAILLPNSIVFYISSSDDGSHSFPSDSSRLYTSIFDPNMDSGHTHHSNVVDSQ